MFTRIMSRRALIAVVALAAVAAAGALRPSQPTEAQSTQAVVERAVRDAHAEAIEMLRTGQTGGLRTYTRNAAGQMVDALREFQSLGAVLTAAAEPSFQETRVNGNDATVVTLTNIEVAYFGFLGDLLTARITWYMVQSGGRWLVDAVELEL